MYPTEYRWKSIDKSSQSVYSHRVLTFRGLEWWLYNTGEVSTILTPFSVVVSDKLHLLSNMYMRHFLSE